MIERATFDPEWGLDDPDVTAMDLGHPLVRRLIEEVKQRAFRPGGPEGRLHYGRTAHMVTPEIEEATVLFPDYSRLPRQQRRAQRRRCRRRWPSRG